MRLQTIILFLLIIFSFNANSQQGVRGVSETATDVKDQVGNTYAIIIGLSDYKQVEDLKFAHRDAQAFENFLLSEAGGKIPKENIETFLNERATRINVGDAISQVARKAKPKDRIYFFFAGHGDMEDLTQIENGLLLLYNSPNGNYFGMNDDVLEIITLKRYLSPLTQKGVEMMFIVDACHSGNLNGGVEGIKQTGQALLSSWGKEYKILSCQPDQLSLEGEEWGGGRGLFSLQFEEGLKGLADADNNGVISMFELQSYVQANVAKYSEYKQIPVITGDLSKAFFRVDPAVLATLKKEKSGSYPKLSSVNSKGNIEKSMDSVLPAYRKIFQSFNKNLNDKKLVWPKDTNALYDYRLFTRRYPNHEQVQIMRRNLAAALTERFNAIVEPQLKGETSYSTKDECYYAAMELDSCLQLLGTQHYMFENLKARKLYMDAMAITWALDESEYNISLKPVVQRSVSLLEESVKLEPNAAYTLSALGTRYFFLYDYEKAFRSFQKFLDLRPKDLYAKYSLALVYMKLKEYDKAIELFKIMIAEKPEIADLHAQLFDAYFSSGQLKQALDYSRKITASVDSLTGYFSTGIYYSKTGNVDSAVFYYSKSAGLLPNCTVCYNNIGQVYYVNNMVDSARKYFALANSLDTTDAFPYFNLATIDAKEKNFRKAIQGFVKSIDYAPSFKEAFVNHLDLYFNKSYSPGDKKSFGEFTGKTYIFDIQYLGYSSILYSILRDTGNVYREGVFEDVFERMWNYKDLEVFTWYHHACYRALKNDKSGALESLEKALKAGFGSYYMILHDMDLKLINGTPEFKNMLARYFPTEVKSKK